MKSYTLQSGFQQQSIIMDELDYFASFLKKNLVDDSIDDESASLNKTILLNCARELHKNLYAYQLLDIKGASQHCSQLEKKLWSYKYLKSTELFHIGLLTICKDTNIPLHDHPDAYGFQYVISGYVKIQEYQHSADKKVKQSISSLQKIAEYNLKKGGISVFQPVVGNIHKINSISTSSVLLSMQLHPLQAQERSWYFPINALPDSKETLFSRIQAHNTRH